MIRVRGPIRDLLEPPSEERVARLEQAVAARRLGRGAEPRRWALMLATAAAAAAIASFVALRVSGDRPPGGIAAATIEAVPAGAVELVRTGDTMLVMLDLDGRVLLDIPPDTGLRWSVDAGLARVDVTGTRFTVARFADRVEVAVTRGTVRVTGAGDTRTLGAGEHLEVRGEPEKGDRAALGDAGDLGAGDERGDHAGAPAPVAGDRTVDAPGVRAAQHADRAGGAPGVRKAQHADRTGGARGGAASVEGGLDQGRAADARLEVAEDRVAVLLARADALRSSGEHRAAIAVLAEISADHAGDARAGLAAFTSARIAQDVLGAPAEAAASLERALGLGLAAELREPARARLFQAYAAANDPAAATRAASDYLASHPHGRHAAEARALAEPR